MCAYGGWGPYVPVATRRAQAAREVAKLKKKGMDIDPVVVSGRNIATSFWGKAWCNHIESFHDYENRLPRGRTYARNGSVCHLQIESGLIKGLVSGSKLYNVVVEITPLSATKWAAMKRACSGKIDSLIDLLRGKVANGVMETVCDRQTGLFPLAGEIKFTCDCPDWAIMCKHVAAVLYGVGARLDVSPERLFLLRGVDHEELVDVGQAIEQAVAKTGSARRRLTDNALGDVFGIDLNDESSPAEADDKDALPENGKRAGQTKKVAKKVDRKGGGAAGKKATRQKAGAKTRNSNGKSTTTGPEAKVARNKGKSGKTSVASAANKTKSRATAKKGGGKASVVKSASNANTSRTVAQASKRKADDKKEAASRAPAVLPFPKTLTGNAVLRWRDSLEETQVQFGARFGVSGSCICQWELKGRKKINPRAEMMEVLQKEWLRCGLRE